MLDSFSELRNLSLQLPVRRSCVPQRIRHLKLQAVRQGWLVWVDDVHDGSLFELQLGEPPRYETAWRSRGNILSKVF